MTHQAALSGLEVCRNFVELEGGSEEGAALIFMRALTNPQQIGAGRGQVLLIN